MGKLGGASEEALEVALPPRGEGRGEVPKTHLLTFLIITASVQGAQPGLPPRVSSSQQLPKLTVSP